MKNFPEHLTNEYEMLECLAYHDYSETILASRKSDNKICVIKIFYSESPLYDSVIPDEIKALDYPYIPKLLDEYKSEDLRYEIREYVPGASLDKIVQSKNLSKHDKDLIALRLCEILDYLHTRSKPVIHRDIKPQNIIVSDSGEIYLIDFGIARTKHDSPELSDTIICTTRYFSAPEQYGFRETDARSDIYSLGQVLRWLYGNDAEELNSIINKCTAFDPDDRYRSVKYVRQRIHAALKRKKIIAGLLIGLAIICGAVGIYLMAYNRKHFEEPLIEEAVRLSLGVGEMHPLSDRDLQSVDAIYIVADKAYATSEEFYAAVDDWYANDKLPEGTLCSLVDCASFTGLKELCIAGESIADLSPISACEKLEKIEIKNNNVSDITVLGELSSLSYVGINSNPVTDISALTKLSDLRYLDICNVKISDPSVLARLGDFEYLDIDNGTQAYMYLPGKTIKNLRLGYSLIKDLNFLKDIKNLETVQIYFAERKQIEALGPVDFKVIYEGVDIPVQDIPYNKINGKKP